MTTTNFKILPLDKEDLYKSGIYIIWFGWKYYIGATMNARQRMATHVGAIKGGFKGERIGKNSITNIVNHLQANPSIIIGHFRMLECVESEFDLVDAEHKWLSPHENNKNCLNYLFKVHRKIGNIIYRPNGIFEIKNVVSNKHISANG